MPRSCASLSRGLQEAARERAARAAQAAQLAFPAGLTPRRGFARQTSSDCHWHRRELRRDRVSGVSMMPPHSRPRAQTPGALCVRMRQGLTIAVCATG